MRTNVLPKFNSGDWWLAETCTQISVSEYDWTINATATWEGSGCYVPTEWLGKTVTIGCSSISSNAGFYIQNSVTWEDIAIITRDTLEVTVTIPADSQAVLAFQAPETPGQLSITGAYAYLEEDNSVSTTIRPTSATGTSWSNVNNAYDNNTATAATVSITRSNYSSRTLNLSFDTSSIPANATIISATLNVIAKQSSSNSTRRITVYGDINGNSSNRVINTQLTSTTNTTLTANITNYLRSLSSLLITGYMTSTQSQTFSIYEVYIDVKYELPQEPINITALTLDKTNVNMNTNGNIVLNCVIEPEDADTYEMVWSCNNSNVTLTPNELECKVIGSRVGNSIVTVTDSLTNISASCEISLSYPIEWTDKIRLGTDKLKRILLGEKNLLRVYLGEKLIFYGSPMNTLSIGHTTIRNESTNLADNAVIVTNYQELNDALYLLQAGQTIYLRAGTYTGSTLWVDTSGTETNPIVIRNYPNEKPILSGFGLSLNAGVSYITLKGLTIANINLTGNDMWGTGVTVSAGCTNITIEDNEFYNLTCETGTGIVSGIQAIYCAGNTTEITTPMSNVIIRNNYIHDCNTGWSEALMMEGNITDSKIINNTIYNTGNIGIDIAGNYSWTGTVGDVNNQARNIEIRENLVSTCLSEYATCAGIYSDGGRNLTIEHNLVYHCQCGIEVGAEEAGATVENFYIRNNLLIDNGRSIGVGGYQETSASHQNTYIYNNTIIGGAWYPDDLNIISIYRTSNLVARNNIFYAQKENVLLEKGNGTNLDFNYNCWYQNGLTSLPEIEGVNSMVADPLLRNNDLTLDGSYTLQDGSPCIGEGNYDANCGTLDFSGMPRGKSIIDIGCYQK